MSEDYDVAKAIKRIEDELIASMIANLDRHRAEENDLGINWEQWQVKQLAALEEYKKRNQRRYGGIFRDINNKIDALITIQRTAGNSDQEVAILEAIKKGAGLRRAAGRQAAVNAQFFRMNDRRMNALIKATKNDLKKAEYAMLRMTNDKYRKIIFDAQMYAVSGSATYEKAVDMATKDFLQAGINCVEYKNGARHTVSDYADMAVRTAGKRAYLAGEGEKRKEWGISTVIMNKRGNPCPKCLPFCGKVLIDDVWSGGDSKDGPYQLMSSAIAAGLYHPRCRDGHTTYFPGISDLPDDKYTSKELYEIEQNAEQEAKRQYAERQMQKFGRLAMYSLDAANREKYRKKEEEWKKASVAEEYSPRKVTDGEYDVDWNKVNSPEYRERLRELSDNSKVIDAIAVRSKWALNNRSGLNTEELYAISLNTGEEIASILKQQNAFGVQRTERFIQKLNAADSAKDKILLIHNHPRGLPPSVSDINALFGNRNVAGITVGHNGSIYYYTRPNKKIADSDFFIAMKRYSRYTEITGMEKALEDLAKDYGFIFKKL